MRIIFLIVIFSGIFSLAIHSQDHSSYGEVEFKSDNKELNTAFNWAKEKALSYVRDDDPVGMWYEAALPGRDAFCMRDVSHQSIGAAILGLEKHNKNMFMKFAENISESKDWCSYWEINKYNKPAPVDYKNDKDFWYNLPANYDILDACYRQYLWTGDTCYLFDPVFLNFYDKTINEYTERWQLSPESILKRDRLINLKEPRIRTNSYYFDKRGIPGYNEGGRGVMKLGIDLHAAQIAAYKAYIQILKLKNEISKSEELEGKLFLIRLFFDKYWWDGNRNEFRTILYEEGTFDYAKVGDNQAFSHYLLYFRVVNYPKQIRSIVNTYLLNKDKIIVELASHIASIFYKYGAEKEAGDLIISLASKNNKRRDYPENSFVIIEDITTGLMGIHPDAKNNMISTLSNLHRGIKMAEIKNVPVLGTIINLKHNAGISSEFSNKSCKLVYWKALFKGKHKFIKINGKRLKAERNYDNLKQIETSYIVIKVKPFETIKAEIK